MPASKDDREPKSAVTPLTRQVRTDADPEKLESQTLAWHFHRLDWEHLRWGFKQLGPTQWRDLLNHLISFEGLTWAKLKEQSGGRGKGGGTNHHTLDIGDLCRDAQNRLVDLRLDEYDGVFSLRLGNCLRLYGIRDDRVFRLLWWDCHHGSKHAVYLTKNVRKNA